MVIKDIVKKYFFHAKNFSLYLLTNVLNAALMIVINPFFAKNLSPNDYAVIGYHTSFQIILLPILNFSFTTYYLRHYFLTPPEEREKLRDTIILMILIWGSISIVLSYSFFYFFFKIRNVDIPFFPYFLFTITTVFLNNFFVLQQIEYRLSRKAKEFFFLTIGLRLIIITTAIITVVFLKLGAIGKMGATSVCTVLYGTYCFFKMYKGNKIDWSVFLKAIKFCWPLALSALLWYFLGSVDRVFLEELKDIETLGIYNVAAGLAGYFAVFYVAMAQTMEPDLLKAIVQKKYKRMLLIAVILIFLNAVPNLVFIVLAKPVVSLLTAGRYNASVPFAKILVLKNISMSFYYTVVMIIVGLGYTKSELGNRIIGAAVCYFMYKYLIGRYGFYGAAWGQSLSFLLLTAIGVGFILINKKKMTKGQI